MEKMFMIITENSSNGIESVEVAGQHFWPIHDPMIRGYTSGEVIGWMIVAAALSALVAFWFGDWFGVRRIKRSAINRNLAEYDIDTETGKIEFYWTGKPERK